MADDLAVARLGEERSLPEGLRKRSEAERREEALAVADHLKRVGLARFENLGQVEAGIAVLRSDERVDVGPVLRPHVAEQMRRDRAALRHDAAVLFPEARADVRVK